MESLPELPSLVKDKSEQFLSAAGVAYTKVCQQPNFHTLSSNTYYCKNTNIILFDNPTVWKITQALGFENFFSLILFVRWALIPCIWPSWHNMLYDVRWLMTDRPQQLQLMVTYRKYPSLISGWEISDYLYHSAISRLRITVSRLLAKLCCIFAGPSSNYFLIVQGKCAVSGKEITW